MAVHASRACMPRFGPPSLTKSHQSLVGTLIDGRGPRRYDALPWQGSVCQTLHMLGQMCCQLDWEQEQPQ